MKVVKTVSKKSLQSALKDFGSDAKLYVRVGKTTLAVSKPMDVEFLVEGEELNPEPKLEAEVVEPVVEVKRKTSGS